MARKAKAKTEAPTLTALCEALLRGNYDILPEGDYTLFTEKEWETAAQHALDGDVEGSDLAWMIARGIAVEEWKGEAWLHDRRRPGTEFIDFGEWFDEDEPCWLARAAESYVPAIGGGA